MGENKFPFRGPKLTALKPNDQHVGDYADAVQRGLWLRVTPNGTKSFRVYRKFNRKPVTITLGKFDPKILESRDFPAGVNPLDVLGNSPALNVRMARRMAALVMEELDAGRDPRAAGLTLGKLFERYHAALVAEGKKGVDGIRWYWERYVGELPDEPRKKHARERLKAPGGVNWQNRLVAKITKAEISRLRFELAEKVGHTTANRVLQLLSAMFNFGRREDLFQGENPVHGLRKFKTNSRERFLQSDEAYKFFEALDAYPDNDFQDYVRLSILTGARRGNVLRMRWDELNLEGSRWTLSGEFTKNGDPLTIPLVGDAVEILRRRQEMAKGYWVFPGGTAEGHAGAFRCAWKRLLENAGLKDFRIHDLRRTMGAWLVGSGASTTVAMRALGHKSVQAAMIYQRLHLDPVRAAMENAVAALHSAVANGKAEAEKQVNDEGTRPQKTESSKRKAPVVEICKASAAAAD